MPDILITELELADLLSAYTNPGETFPTGSRLEAAPAFRTAGAFHGEQDADGTGLDYTRDEVRYAIMEYCRLRDAQAYDIGYDQGYAIGLQKRAARKAAQAEVRRILATPMSSIPDVSGISEAEGTRILRAHFAS